ncbi:MAG: phenol hydroxylase subunit [Candidatus Thiodiazotropha sp. (ex Gloverina cf. vestifex)]|nr:phenol hydroxylase subunit [Candidatus Thiodiazotropha sp. (ex Gloverina cf. vestifex)]
MREYVPKIGQVYIRVIGERLGKFVEFEFSINDEDLTVELILPHDAFKIFCDKHQARLIHRPEEIGNEVNNNRRPGLYGRTSH